MTDKTECGLCGCDCKSDGPTDKEVIEDTARKLMSRKNQGSGLTCPSCKHTGAFATIVRAILTKKISRSVMICGWCDHRWVW